MSGISEDGREIFGQNKITTYNKKEANNRINEQREAAKTRAIVENNKEPDYTNPGENYFTGNKGGRRRKSRRSRGRKSRSRRSRRSRKSRRR